MPDSILWEDLFKTSLALIDEIEAHGTKNLYWTFGGGTVLMRRYQHRFVCGRSIIRKIGRWFIDVRLTGRRIIRGHAWALPTLPSQLPTFTRDD